MLCPPLRSTLVSNSPAYRVLAASLASQHARHTAWRASRARIAAAINQSRVSTGAPVYGADVIDLVSGIAHPTSKALNTHLATVTDYAWVGPSETSEAVFSLCGTLVRKGTHHPGITPLPDGGDGGATATAGATAAPDALLTQLMGAAAGPPVGPYKPAGLRGPQVCAVLCTRSVWVG